MSNFKMQKKYYKVCSWAILEDLDLKTASVIKSTIKNKADMSQHWLVMTILEFGNWKACNKGIIKGLRCS